MASNYLFVFFRVSYYLCFVPYRFKKLENGIYALHSNLTQKVSHSVIFSRNYMSLKNKFLRVNIILYYNFQVLCGISHCFSLYLYGTSLRRAVEGMSVGSPVIYFRFFENISCFMYKALIVKCFWLKKDLFLKIINFPKLSTRQYSNEKRNRKVETFLRANKSILLCF